MSTWFLVVILISPLGEVQTSLYNPTDSKSNNYESCYQVGLQMEERIKTQFGTNMIVSFTCRSIKYDDIMKSLSPTL